MNTDKTFRVVYKGQVLSENLTYDQTADVLHDLALKYYEDEQIDVNEIKLEEID
jgi:hypothetical protein